jgi:hypothetical protein
MKVLELKGKEHKDFVYGVHGEMTLDQYAEMPFNETYEKTEGTGRSFALYSKTHKINDNVIANTALVLDIDKSPVPVFDDLKTELERLGVEAVIGTTHSNDPDNNLHCLRAVIPFKIPVAKDSFKTVVKNFVQSSAYITDIENKGHLDQRVYVPSQYWLDPSVHPDREFSARKEKTKRGGPLLPDIRKREYTKSDSSIGVDVGQNMPSEAILSGSEQYLEGSRDNGLTHEVGLLINKGLTKGEVLGQLVEINERKCIPPLSLDDVKRIADSIWKSHYKDKPEPVKKKAFRNSYTIEEGRNQPPVQWLVEDLIEEQTMCAMYGDTGCTKSFLAIDLGMHLALGKDWFGLKVYRSVPVVYVAVEGGGGMIKRVNGWLESHDDTEIPNNFRIDRDPIYPTNKESIRNFIEYYKELGFEKGFVFIDTLNANARADGLNEDGTDMGLIVDAFQVIGRELNSSYMIVHHSGKDESRGMRGHSSLKASLDTVIHVEPSGSNYKWSIEKLKEGEDQKVYGYEAPVVDLGVDAKGKSITTLVVNPTGMLSEDGPRKVNLVKNQKTIFQLVRDVLGPSTTHRTSYEAVIEYIKQNWTTHQKDKRGYDGGKVIDAIKSKGLLGYGTWIDPDTKMKFEDQIWLTKSGIDY